MTGWRPLETRLPRIAGEGGALRPLAARRYRLDVRLGAGEGGWVYAARDLLQDRNVALKISDATGTLEHEFLVGRTLRHPHVVRVLEAGPCEDGLEYLVMELLRGGPLDRVLQRHGTNLLGPSALGVARALRYVHSRGYVHGDLKPDNIWVSNDQDGCVAKVLDFGLATVGAGAVRGSLAYLAPELLDGGSPGTASDLFALGVSLYEAATGTNPFVARTTAETCRRLRDLEVATPPTLDPALAEIIMRLMSRDPALRIASAARLEEALLELPQVATFAAEREARIPSLPETDLVGHEGIIESVLTLAGPTADGGAAVLTGAPGNGKSRLLDEIAVHAQLRGHHVLRLEAGGTQRPPIHQLLHGLALLRPDAYRAAVDSRVDPVPSWIRTPAEPGRVHDVPSVVVVAQLVETVARDQRILVTWDDVDCLAPDDLAALRVLSPRLAGGGLTLVMGRRCPTEDLDQLLGTLQAETRSLEVAPLSLAHTRELLELLLGQVSRLDEVAALVHSVSGGNPGQTREVVETALAKGLLQWNEGRLVPLSGLFGLSPSELAPSGGTPAALAHIPLPRQDTFALQTAALLVEPFRAETVRVLLTTHGVQVERSGMERLEDRNLFRAAEDGRLSFRDRRVRSAIRETSTLALPPELLRLIARDQAATHPEALLECAELLDLVGASIWAQSVVTSAGIDAAAHGRPGHALTCFEWALTHNPTPAAFADLHERAGDVALELGEFGKARAHYSGALDHLLDRRWAVERKLGWAWALEGDYHEAIPALSSALATAQSEDAGVEGLQYAHFALGWSLMMAGRYDEAEAQARLGFGAGPEDGQHATRLWRLTGTIFWHRGEGVPAVEAFRRAIKLAKGHDDRAAAADAEMGLGTALRITGDTEAASAAYERAIADNRRLGRLIPVAKCLNGLGIVRYLQGRWEEAIVAWEQYRDACIPVGDRAELVLALNNLGFLYADTGELERSRRALEKGLALATEAGFERARAMVLGNLGEALLRMGELDAAERALDACCALATKLGVEDERLEAERRLARLALERGDALKARKLAHVAFLAAEAVENRDEMGNALLVEGLAAVALGERAVADALLTTALEHFGEAGSRLGILRARLARASVRAETQPEVALDDAREVRAKAAELGAASLVLEADAIVHEASARATRPLDDRMLKALRLAASFSRILDLEQLLDEVTDSAIEITSAERGMLILFSGDGAPVVHAARGVNEDGHSTLSMEAFRVSRTVADRVYEESRSLAVTDLHADEDLGAQQSIREMQLRSVLCVPLLAGEERLGILYVDSRESRASLGQEALTILETLAAQAASAVVNARQFEAERRKRRLMATMMHELRTPLGGVQGFLDLLVREMPGIDPELAEMAWAVREQVARIGRLTDETRRLDRIIGHRDEFRPKEFSLADVVTSVATVLRSAAAQRSQTLTVQVDEGIPVALGEPDWVSQVLGNIVSNAIRYSPEGGHIRVDASHRETRANLNTTSGLLGWMPEKTRSGQELVVRVIDTGPGVDLEERAHIFDWHRRGSAGLRCGQGSGIGLALAKEIVKVHGGAVGVEDAEGGGAVFWFTIPGAEGPNTDQPRTGLPATGRTRRRRPVIAPGPDTRRIMMRLAGPTVRARGER